MPLSDVVVHRVVPWRDLERAGAEVLLDQVVSDDRKLATDERQHGGPADQGLVAIIARIHRDAGVGEHRLRPPRRDHDLASALDRVTDVVQRVVVLLPLDLPVAYHRAVMRTPFHDTRSPKDPTPVVES